MSIYHLDESDEPRKCPGCDKGLVDMPPEVAHRYEKSPIHNGEVCPICHGSGRLGGDGPRVVVEHYTSKFSDANTGWRYRRVRPAEMWHGPYPTSDAALESAREAHRNA